MFKSNRQTLTVEAAAYAANDLIGGRPAWRMRTPGGAGKLTRVYLKSLTSVGVASVLYLFDADPSDAGSPAGATTFTENAAFTLNSADRSKLIHAVEIASGDWKDFSARTGLYVAEKTLAVPFQFDAGVRDIFGAWVMGGAHTPGSTSDVEIIVGAELD